MILNSVSASNVLKFEQLELSNLPDSGVIAISGFNESGKSTIGETICFALFGRTFSIDNNKLEKIIRWGASECSVTIGFTKHCFIKNNVNTDSDTENEQYAITRMLDFSGNHSAKLYKASDPLNPIARGIKPVEEALYKLTSIKFEEFIESFYLAQREITTPHPHSYTLKSMAGVSTLEQCDKVLSRDIEKDNLLSDELSQRIILLSDEVTELAIDEAQLDFLAAQTNAAQQAKDTADKTCNDYQANVKDYRQLSAKLRSSLSKKESGSFARFLFFITSIMTFILWISLVIMPEEVIHGEITNLLQSNFPAFTATYYPYLLYMSIASALLFILLWLPVINHNRNIQTLHRVGVDLAEKMRALDISRVLQTDEHRLKQMNKISQGVIEEQELKQSTADDLQFLHLQLEEQNHQSAKISSALIIETERVKQAVELNKKIHDLQAQITAIEAQNKVRELASELLIGATRHLSTCFNQTLRDHVSKTLPLFTDSRYERLQIDDDLTVRIFSNNKYDFMELDEISSGTQRQIMLAVRLALSQEMVSRKVHSRQFMILDEPFAFFDEQRTKESLKVLPQLSQDLPQVWIIAQTFPKDMKFARSVYCERDIIKQIA